MDILITFKLVLFFYNCRSVPFDYGTKHSSLGWENANGIDQQMKSRTKKQSKAEIL